MIEEQRGFFRRVLIPFVGVTGLLVFVCTLVSEAASPTWGTSRTRGLPDISDDELARLKSDFKSGRRRVTFRPRSGNGAPAAEEAPQAKSVVTRLPKTDEPASPAPAPAPTLVATVPGAPPSIPAPTPVAPVAAMTPVPPVRDALAPPPATPAAQLLAAQGAGTPIPPITPAGPPLNEANRLAALPAPANERTWSMRNGSGQAVPLYVGSDAPVGAGPGAQHLARVTFPADRRAANRPGRVRRDGYAADAMLGQAPVGGDYPLEPTPGAPSGPFPPGPNDGPPPPYPQPQPPGSGMGGPPSYQPPAQVPFGGNTGPGGPIATPSGTIPPQLSGKTLAVDWKDADIRGVVKILSDILKVDFLIEPSLQGKVTLLGPKEMPIEYAEGVLHTILEFQGFAVEGTGPIRRIVRLKTDSANRVSNFVMILPGGRIPEPTGKLEDDLKQVYIHAFRFKHVGVNEMLNIIRFFTGTGNNIIPYVPGNMIFVIDHPLNLRRIRDLVAELDVPGPQRVITTVKVNHAQAKSLAEKVQQILQKRTEGEPDPGTREYKLSKPSFIADDRTNSILLISLEDDVRMLVTLIEQLDTPEINTPIVKVIHLQHQMAEAVANQVNQAYKVGGNADPSLQYSVIADPGTQSLILSSYSQRMVEKVEDLIQFLDNPVTPEGGVNVHHYRMEFAEAAKVEKVLSNLESAQGQSKTSPTKILADEPSNSLVIVANQAKYNDIVNVIKKLDVLRPQVEIETLIVELSQSLANQFSSDFNIIPADSDGGRAFGLGSTSTVNNFFSGQNAGFTLGVLAPGAFDINAAATGNISERSKIQYLLRLFKSDNRAQIIQSPKLMAADGSTSKLTVGSKVQVLQGLSQGTVPGQLPITNFSSEDLGLSMSLTPRITKGDYVSLKFNVELKDRVGGAAGTINFGPIQTPVFTKTAVENEVMLKNEQTLVIGGLVRENKGKQLSKIPGLGDLPIIGRLFSSRNKTTDRNDLLIFLTPHIVRNSFDAQRVTDAEGRVLQWRDLPGHTHPHERGLPITARSLAEDLKRNGSTYRTRYHKPKKLFEHSHREVNQEFQHGHDGRGRNTHMADLDDDGERGR